MKPYLEFAGIGVIKQKQMEEMGNMKKFKKGKISLTIITVLMGIALMTGCGASGTADNAKRNRAKQDVTFDTDMESAYFASGDYSGEDYDYYETTEAAAYEEDIEAAYDEAVSDEAESKSSGKGTEKEQSTNKIDIEKLVYRCNISIETLNYNSTITDFKSFIKECGGFLESENATLNGGYDYYNKDASKLHTYTATVRVPSDKYEEFVNKTDGLGEITGKNQNVTNVSQEYSDLSVELDVLAAERASYVEMLKQAKDLDDMDNIILITDKITDIDIQVNQIKTRLNTIDNDVAYSYVNVTIREVKEYVDEPDDTFGQRFMKEVKAAWKSFFFGFQNFIIWLVSNIPGLIVIFLIGFGVWKLIIKKIIKKAKANKAEREKRRKEMQQYGPRPYPMAYPVNPAAVPVATAPANTAVGAPANSDVKSSSAKSDDPTTKNAGANDDDTDASNANDSDTKDADANDDDTKNDDAKDNDIKEAGATDGKTVATNAADKLAKIKNDDKDE